MSRPRALANNSSTPARVATFVEIPKAAIRRDGNNDIVFVVKDDKAERRAVSVMSTQGDVVRLASGVSGGEQVVIEGPQLHDGEKVEVKP